MDTKQWLSRAYKIDLQIESKEEQIAAWRSLASKTTMSYTAIMASCGDGDKVGEWCAKIVDAEVELQKEKAQLVDIKQEIKTAIDNVEDVCARVLLEQRYLLGKSWDDIAEFMGYNEYYIKKELLNVALEQIVSSVSPKTPLNPIVSPI